MPTTQLAITLELETVPDVFDAYFGQVGIPYLGLIAIALPSWKPQLSVNLSHQT